MGRRPAIVSTMMTWIARVSRTACWRAWMLPSTALVTGDDETTRNSSGHQSRSSSRKMSE